MKDIDVTKLKKMIDENDDFQLVDIRETHEFDFSHIPKSISYPRFLIRREEFGPLDKNKLIVLVCLTNKNCPEIRDILLTNGFNNVSCLNGGIAEWIDCIDPKMDFYL